MVRTQNYAVILFIFSALLLATACSEVSPALSRYYDGRILTVSVREMKTVSELRYTYTDAERGQLHFLVTPSSADMELAMLRISVGNHKATSAVVNIDEQAAQLLDFANGRYFPVNVFAVQQEVGPPENPADEEKVPEFLLLWNGEQEDGTRQAFNLLQNTSLVGWMLFEVPKDARLRELRWRAGDSLTIQFWPN